MISLSLHSHGVSCCQCLRVVAVCPPAWTQVAGLTVALNYSACLQVEGRRCNFFGAVHDYSIMVIDKDDCDFGLDDVPPDQIYMHFFPGSRVNITWRPPQQVNPALLDCPSALGSAFVHASACESSCDKA